MNFLDPQTKNGKPFGLVRYREIAKECYLISKHIHTSYTDLMKITPSERQFLMEFMIEEAKQEREAYERAKMEAEARKKY